MRQVWAQMLAFGRLVAGPALPPKINAEAKLKAKITNIRRKTKPKSQIQSTLPTETWRFLTSVNFVEVWWTNLPSVLHASLELFGYLGGVNFFRDVPAAPAPSFDNLFKSVNFH